MPRFQSEYFQKEDFSYPAEEFILSLDLKMRAKVYGLLDLLEKNGNNLREPYSKLLEDGIFELRIKQGSDISRVLYFFYVGRKIILTNGFMKKSQKTPPAEITLAKKYRTEYKMRKDLEK